MLPPQSHYLTVSLRFLGHALGAGYALALTLGCIRAERELASLNIELARTFKRQAMMILLILFYRCLACFASTNDLTHPTNDPLAVISKLFFYLTQLPLELVILWNHAVTDYRTVVDAGARGDGPRAKLENGKKTRKWKLTTCLKDMVASMVLRFKGQHKALDLDSGSYIVPLMRTEGSIRSQTSTGYSSDASDIEKQSVQSFPSTSSTTSARSSTLGSRSTDRYSPYPMDEKEKEQWSLAPAQSLVEDVGTWTRRSIWE
jgi:hypothetical protein